MKYGDTANDVYAAAGLDSPNCSFPNVSLVPCNVGINHINIHLEEVGILNFVLFWFFRPEAFDGG